MKRLIQLVLVFFLLTSLAACGRRSHELPPLPAGATVLAFGDSLTFGTGAAPQESYPAVLASLIGRPVVNAGIPGETTADGLVRFQATLQEHRPALIILCLGGNDFLQHQGESETVANL
ncbi:GDSL-type esterase/lipase family protein, partial [Chitinimonas sp.]|uniref:GDSL-type esterase/lipase family protein n=1 Tax=Chitinimonas sp. TaxID=1934313 RepID=UPI0035B31F63